MRGPGGLVVRVGRAPPPPGMGAWDAFPMMSPRRFTPLLLRLPPAVVTCGCLGLRDGGWKGGGGYWVRGPDDWGMGGLVALSVSFSDSW